MTQSKIDFTFETHERAVEVNKRMLEDAIPLMGGCVVYSYGQTKFTYEVTSPKSAIDWLIAALIIDPTKDCYIIHDEDEGKHITIDTWIANATVETLQAKVEEYGRGGVVWNGRDNEKRMRLKRRLEVEIERRAALV